MSEIKRINTRAELEQKREHFIQCLATQDKQILICGGTGCVAGGSLKIYDRLKELMEERDIACTVQLEEEPHDHSIGLKKSGCHGFCEMGPLVHIEPMGVMYIQGETLWGEKLSRLATIYILVLKLIYDEQMAAVSSSSHIVTTLGAVNGKAGEFHVLSGLPSPTEMRRTVAFLKKYQIVEPVDVMEELDENSRLVIYPCINTVLLGDDIRELLETFSEEEDSGDKTGVQSALENLPE